MAQKWSKSWILSAASAAACTFLALDCDVENDVGRGAEVTCFKADFGIPGNIDGGSLGRLPPLTDTHSQLKFVSEIYIYLLSVANFHFHSALQISILLSPKDHEGRI